MCLRIVDCHYERTVDINIDNLDIIDNPNKVIVSVNQTRNVVATEEGAEEGAAEGAEAPAEA